MKSRMKFLKAIRYSGGIVLTIGIITFLIGFFGSGSSVLTPMGIGAVMAAVFIFLMGMFFVMTEEMLEKIDKGITIAPSKIK